MKKPILLYALLVPLIVLAESFDLWMSRQSDKDLLRGRERYDAEEFARTHRVVVITNSVVVTNSPTLPQALIDGYLGTLQALGVYGMDPTEASTHLQGRLAASTNAADAAQLLAASAALINFRLEIVRRGVDPDNIGDAMGGIVTQTTVTVSWQLISR